jgi:hypothetical protein
MELRRVQRQLDFLELEAEVLEYEPGAQRPGGEILIADDQGEPGSNY